MEIVGVLVNAPYSPLGSVKVYPTVEAANIDVTATGKIRIPFSPVTGEVGLIVVVNSALFGSDLERVPILIELNPFPTAAVVILVPGETRRIPLAVPSIIESVLTGREYQFCKFPDTRVREEPVSLGKSPHILERKDFGVIFKSVL